ncbi:MAG: DUF1697 domain-containing protein [Verrucomicrobia bacterium]|nr:MAG: DUF1697 domain-containing protein [Verrucomicrobiota bacterium]
MPIYVAMLRGINVGRGKVVKMERLRASLESLGFDGVRTYVQSGNVVFESEQKSAAELSKKIETKILRDFGFAVPVILKRSKEIEQIVRDNPLVKEKGIDHSKLHVTFLSDAPPTAALKALEPLATSRERFRVLNREVYLYCPDGYGTSKLANTTIEKKLSVVATTRNWRTVNALLEMAKAG